MEPTHRKWHIAKWSAKLLAWRESRAAGIAENRKCLGEARASAAILTRGHGARRLGVAERNQERCRNRREKSRSLLGYRMRPRSRAAMIAGVEASSAAGVGDEIVDIVGGDALAGDSCHVGVGGESNRSPVSYGRRGNAVANVGVASK